MRQLSRAACTGFIVVAILAACGRAPVPAGYDFVTHSLPSSPQMAALLEGSLAITGGPTFGGYCLVVVEGSRAVTFVAWPERFTLVLSGDGKVEVHGDGKVLRQGEEVRLGGGEITGGVRHSIQGACQYSHYFAAESFP